MIFSLTKLAKARSRHAHPLALPLLAGFMALSVNAPLNAQPADKPQTELLGEGQFTLDLKKISLSGLSSGGYMATQFELAHSDWVSGVGIIAAGPYYCAQNSIQTALSQCVNQVKTPLDLAPLSAQINQWNKQGKLPDLANLKQHKVWLLSGTLDTKVLPEISNALVTQYQQWVEPQNIKYVQDKPFAHLFPTLGSGNQCSESQSPFIGSCDYDAAGELLNFILPDMHARSPKPKGTLRQIDQHKLGGEPAQTLASQGYVYAPKACQQGETCTVHVSFHGCNQNTDAVGDVYAKQTGLNNWADTNHMLVLYPQTKNSMMMPLNPQGCWDWWGYTGEDYANSDGKQIQAVSNIIRALAKQESTNE